MNDATAVPWSDGQWTEAPVDEVGQGGDLLVTAAKGSDAWRQTAHGYSTDSAHALLTPMLTGTAVEVTFIASMSEQFDQAGIMLRASEDAWIKAGVEFADGALQVGAVVTRGASDWSSAPVPGWAGRAVTMSASRLGNAVTIRARVGDEPFTVIRLAWFDPAVAFSAGPYLAAPTRPGLTVRFTRWSVTDADATVHPDGLPDF